MMKSSSTPHRTASAGTKRTATDVKPDRHGRTEITSQRTKQPAGRAGQSDAPSQQAPDGAGNLSSNEIRALVAGAAYFRAEARGFAPGHELDDWVAAEAEINERLARGC